MEYNNHINKNYKVVNLIASLDTKRYKDVLKVLQKRGNKDDDHQLLVVKYFRSRCLNSEYQKEPLSQIARNCFDDLEVGQCRLRYLMSGLYTTIQEVLESQQIESHESIRDFLFVDALMDMGALELSLEVLEKAVHSKYFEKSLDNHYKYKIFDLQYELVSLSSRKLDEPLNNSLHHLHIATLESYLKQYCRMLSLSKLSNHTFDYRSLTPLIEILKKEVDPNNPMVSRWNWAVQIVRDDDPLAFQCLKDNITSIHREGQQYPDMRMQYFICINFAIRQANTGLKEFIQQAFDLYKLGLESKLIYRGDYLSKFTYRNIINHGLALHHFKWVKEFMTTYHDALSPLHRKNTYTYNLARYHFYLKEYSTSLSYLREAEFNDTSYNLDARRMILRIYFDQDEWITLDYFLDSFRAYILRKKSSNKSAKSYAPLVKYSKSFIRNMNKPHRLKDLLARISSEVIFVDQRWLIQEVERKLGIQSVLKE